MVELPLHAEAEPPRRAVEAMVKLPLHAEAESPRRAVVPRRAMVVLSLRAVEAACSWQASADCRYCSPGRHRCR
jgi:hypothetical protein